MRSVKKWMVTAPPCLRLRQRRNERWDGKRLVSVFCWAGTVIHRVLSFVVIDTIYIANRLIND